MEFNIKEHANSEYWFGCKTFYDMISTKDYKIIVEVGAWKGHSISYLAKKFKEQNKDVTIYAVDLFDDSPIFDSKDKEKLKPYRGHLWDIYNYNLVEAGVRDMITDIKSNSWEAAEQFEDHSLDFVYIDADHKYDSVKRDIIAWLPKVKNGGIISGHDYYNADDVKKAVDELMGAVAINKESCTWYKKI